MEITHLSVTINKQYTKIKNNISIKIDDRLVFKLSRYILFNWTLAFSVVRTISFFFIESIIFVTSPIKEF